MHEYGVLALSNFVQVFLLGFQSRNVQASRYVLAFCTSLGISVTQFVFVRAAVKDDILLMCVAALSGAFGIVTAILVHDRLNGWLNTLGQRWRKLWDIILFEPNPWSKL